MAHASPWQRSVWPGRLPRHIWALGILALALLLGVAAVDDYGVWGDTYAQSAIGEATLRHLAGERGLNLLWPPEIRLYGPIFETPLAVIERILGRDDSRRIFLSRYLLSHLFFLAAGFAGYLLALRMFGSRWLALFALLLFLLHPRIYAHSFFNSKDMPFLAMFMICLWLAHRAFGTSESSGSSGAAVNDGAAGAFAVCGVAAGLLTNLRMTGLVFVAVVVLMRLCDIVLAGSWRERRCAIASCALFAFATVTTYYATMPYLWADPLERFREILAVMLAHPVDDPLQWFQGRLVDPSELPPSYLPVWFAITTPPLALALGAVGFVALVWRCGAAFFASDERMLNPAHRLALHMAALLRNTPLRFELLVGGCFALPVLAAVVLQPVLYNGWRHFFFLWAPFVLLAASGLRTLAEGARGAGRRFLPQVPAAVVVGGLAALGLGAIAVGMARLHPDQGRYFNVLATGPSHRSAAAPAHFHGAIDVRPGFAYILEELAAHAEPDAVFNARTHSSPSPLGFARHQLDFGLLSQRDQRRFKFDPNADMDFFLRSCRFSLVLYERRLYGETVLQVATPNLSLVDAATAGAYRALYRDVTAARPALGGETDVYRSETAVTWVRESCPAGGVNRRQRMAVVPLDATRARQQFCADGVRIGGACLWQAALPEYAIAEILLPGIGTLASEAHLEERRRRHAAISTGPPAARSTFDVYLEDGTLFYIKSPCVRADTEAPFFVHVWPAHLDDLPHVRRRLGFDALDFRFGMVRPLWRYASGGYPTGDIFDGICMATLKLRDYPVARIATGQHTPGGGSLWRVDIGGG